MTGKILVYNADSQMGIIRAEDGNRYDFIGAEVRNAQNAIMQGSEVDFMLDEQGNPIDIYVVKAVPAQQYVQHPSQPAMQASPVSAQPAGTLKTNWIGILFSLEGCISRKEFWTAYLGIFIYYVIVYFIADATFVPAVSNVSDDAVFGLGSLYNSGVAASNEAMRWSHIYGLLWKASLPVIWVYIALSVKRFHDANYSGAMWFVNFIPFIGQFIVFILNGFVGSVRIGNRFCQQTRAVINTPEAQSQGYNASVPSSVKTSSHSAPTKATQKELSSLQIAPWFVTLLLGPAVFVFLSISYGILRTGSGFLGSFYLENLKYGSNLLLLLVAIGGTYFASQKIDIVLKYMTIKTAKLKDESEKVQSIGFLSLEPSSAFLLLLPSLIILSLFVEDLFGGSIMILLLAPIGLAIYMLALNKQVVFIAMGDESNAKEHKYTAFKSWTSALLLAPGIAISLLLIFFSVGSVNYSFREVAWIMTYLVFTSIVAAAIKQIITMKRLQPIVKVKNDDKE